MSEWYGGSVLAIARRLCGHDAVTQERVDREGEQIERTRSRGATETDKRDATQRQQRLLCQWPRQAADKPIGMPALILKQS